MWKLEVKDTGGQVLFSGDGYQFDDWYDATNYLRGVMLEEGQKGGVGFVVEETIFRNYASLWRGGKKSPTIEIRMLITNWGASKVRYLVGLATKGEAGG